MFCMTGSEAASHANSDGQKGNSNAYPVALSDLHNFRRSQWVNCNQAVFPVWSSGKAAHGHRHPTCMHIYMDGSRSMICSDKTNMGCQPSRRTELVLGQRLFCFFFAPRDITHKLIMGGFWVIAQGSAVLRVSFLTAERAQASACLDITKSILAFICQGSQEQETGGRTTGTDGLQQLPMALQHSGGCQHSGAE